MTMQTVTLDANMVAKLREVKTPVSLQDEQGLVLGCFTPAYQDPNEFFDDPRYLYIPNLTKEEREQRRQERQRNPWNGEGGFTLKQTWQRILANETDPESRAILEKAIRDLDESDRCDTP
jgi:hypothetical protein